jgi:hypothetical protein
MPVGPVRDEIQVQVGHCWVASFTTLRLASESLPRDPAQPESGGRHGRRLHRQCRGQQATSAPARGQLQGLATARRATSSESLAILLGRAGCSGGGTRCSPRGRRITAAAASRAGRRASRRPGPARTQDGRERRSGHSALCRALHARMHAYALTRTHTQHQSRCHNHPHTRGRRSVRNRAAHALLSSTRPTSAEGAGAS